MNKKTTNNAISTIIVAAAIFTVTASAGAVSGQVQDITLKPGESWSGTIPAVSTLSFDGKLVYSKPAGANYVLQVSVNGQAITSSLLNKGQAFKYSDGRTFNYKLNDAWILFYSPDYSANNSSAGGGYQVLTNPGQAYRYSWDISSITAGKEQMDVAIKNVGPTYPITVRLMPNDAVIFPIKELGNCADQGSCKAYCAVTGNITACLDYAQSHSLMKLDEIAQARKMTAIAETGGPGGCKDKDSCAAYCENSTDHLNECIAFAEKTGLVSGDALKEMQSIQSALKAGGQLPGGCKNKNDCQLYCSASAHMEECIGFAEKSGLIKGKELEEAKKVLPFIKSGETPGGCTTKDQCQTYCADSSRAVECVSFAEKAGLISKEEADMARKTGGKGPNGCTSKESCDVFCNQKANQQSCLNFAKEHDLIPAEQLKQIEEGTARMRMGLSQFPEEIVQCLKDKVGSDTVGEIESGSFVPNKEFGETIQGCFNAFKPKMQAKIQEGLKYATPEVTGCLETALGASGFQKMQQGDIDSPEEGDKVKVCFEKMKDQAKEQMQKGAEQMNQIPAEARDCVKQKLGGDIFEKIQSGDPEQMKNANPGSIQSAIMSCVSQSIPSGGQGVGPSQEQIQEMMKSGVPPTQEKIQEMIKQKMPQLPEGMPSNIPGAPTQEQIQQMIQKNMPSGIPQMPQGVMPPSGFPTPTYP